MSPQWRMLPGCPCVSLTIITHLSEESIVRQAAPAHGRPSTEKNVSQYVTTRTQHPPVTVKFRDMEELTGSGNRDIGLFGAELTALLRPRRGTFFIQKPRP